MQKITSSSDLRKAIVQLEYERAVQKKEMKEDIKEALEHLKPASLIKSTLRTPGVKENILGATVGMAAGYLAKRLIVGKPKGFVKKFIGNLLQKSVSKFIAKRPEYITMAGQGIAGIFRKKHTAYE